MISIEISRGPSDGLHAMREGIPETVQTWHGRTTVVGSSDFELSDSEILVLVVNFLRAGYARFTVYLEDTIVVSPKPGFVVCFDAVTAIRWQSPHFWTTDEIIAILSLALSGDEIPEAAQFYKEVEKLLESCPRECRPIP